MKPLNPNQKWTLKSSRRWGVIFLGILIMIFLGTVYSYSVFRVALEYEFQIGSTKSGMPYMVALAFYALFMLLTGRHIERYQPRNIIIVGGLLVAFGWILSSFAANIYMLTITYGCISGAGVGIAYGVLVNLAAKWFPDKRGLAVGLVLIGFGLSPLITAPVARILVEHHGIMRAFLILGISFGTLLPIMAFSLKYPDHEHVPAGSHQIKHVVFSDDVPLEEMIKTMSFKGVYANFTIGTMIGLMMIGMTNNVGVEYFEIEPSTVPTLMAIFAVFNGLGRPTFGWITDRFTSRNAMILSYLLIMAAAIGLITLGNHVTVYVATFSIFWFNLGGWLAIAPTATLKLYGIVNYAENYGLVFTAYGIGAIAGVVSSGILHDFHGNYLYLFYYVIALCVLGIILTNKYIKK